MNIQKNKYKILLFLLTISLLASLVLSITPTPPICEEGCDIVQTSQYASLLGIKNSTYGVLIFLVLSFVTFSQILNPSKKKEKILKISLLLGTLVSLYFLYLQAFTINAWCKYCLVVDFSVILGTIIIFVKWKK